MAICQSPAILSSPVTHPAVGRHAAAGSPLARAGALGWAPAHQWRADLQDLRRDGGDRVTVLFLFTAAFSSSSSFRKSLQEKLLEKAAAV